MGLANEDAELQPSRGRARSSARVWTLLQDRGPGWGFGLTSFAHKN